ncbi:hypothetical protein [Streptomyces sp. A1136]|uniref:hypothetical protein n=1 Tax=Streptomyces sp. A1136 TaxID=2563102 RepID=UPI00109E4CBC|nr:hypothetical protein [Streptomyces sp. A1136]THA49964.1 hypothetical protein E6R62_26365 [Streptomyces sp. A1136]
MSGCDALPHVHSFCNGLGLDRAAVNAGLALPHHNGRIEGVNIRATRTGCSHRAGQTSRANPW